MNTSKYLNYFLCFLFVVFFISLVCGFRAIMSIGVAMILITGVIKNKFESGSFRSPELKNIFFIAYCIFYSVQMILLLFSSNHAELGKHLLLKSSVIFVPMAICCSDYININTHKKLMKRYLLIMATALAFCLCAAVYKFYFLKAPTDVFFYHALVSPFKQHAVQVSILLFIALIHLLQNAREDLYVFSKALHYLLIIYFTAFILLLSSKLVIAFSAVGFIYYFFAAISTVKRRRLASIWALIAGIAMIALVLATSNKISKRYAEIIHTNTSLINRKSFDPGIYFDGVQFRLLQFRFVKEILSEKNAWLSGVSDDAQVLIDDKYISLHMYAGDGSVNNHGYLDYNTHNQFLESLLQSGIAGLVAFIFIWYAMIHLAVRKKSSELFFVIFLLLAYSLNESVLEKQYSITIFTFFPLFIYYGSIQKSTGAAVSL